MGIVSAVGLYILISIFSSGAESDSRWKILVLAIGSAIVQAVVLQILPGGVGLLVAILSSLALIAGGLMFWCRVERQATLKIVGSYFGLCVAILLISVYLHRASA